MVNSRFTVLVSSLSLLLQLLATTSAAAEEIGDTKAGAAFAKKVCAECHTIGLGQDTSPNPKAPPFAKVAATPGMNERALVVWLQSSHPSMPNFILADKDRDDVIAYITSLKPVPPQ